jgi:hypothetical protein
MYGLIMFAQQYLILLKGESYIWSQKNVIIFGLEMEIIFI